MHNGEPEMYRRCVQLRSHTQTHTVIFQIDFHFIFVSQCWYNKYIIILFSKRCNALCSIHLGGLVHSLTVLILLKAKAVISGGGCHSTATAKCPLVTMAILNNKRLKHYVSTNNADTHLLKSIDCMSV